MNLARYLTLAAAVSIAAPFTVCCSRHASPASPTSRLMAGRWQGILPDRAPCVGDWSSFVLTMSMDGTGQVITRDQQRLDASEVIANGVTRFDVALLSGQGECQTLSLVVTSVQDDGAGNPIALSGRAIGRCCGTIDTMFTLRAD